MITLPRSHSKGCFWFPYRGTVVDGELKGDYFNCYSLVNHVTSP